MAFVPATAAQQLLQYTQYTKKPGSQLCIAHVVYGKCCRNISLKVISLR